MIICTSSPPEPRCSCCARLGPKGKNAIPSGRFDNVKAIISDIHSNLEALQAVLADIAQHDVTEIYCLGDIIGYGPNPRECIDLVMKCKLVLLGNHDQGAMFDPEGFNHQAEKAIFWTRSQLETSGENRVKREKRWEFLS